MSEKSLVCLTHLTNTRLGGMTRQNWVTRKKIPSEGDPNDVTCTNCSDLKGGRNLPPGPDLEILLVGKIGHGKSATANSILGQEHFGADFVQGIAREVDGRKLLVVDTPGFCNTEFLDEDECRMKSEKDISLATSLSHEGFHAILIVLRYGVRMTAAEIEAIKEMKYLLGNDFIREHGILLLTGGDGFESNMKGKKSFKTWCEEQTGFMLEILQECRQRCLLFNNFGVEATLKQQRYDLVQMIDGMTNGKRYKRDSSKIPTTEYNDPKVPKKRRGWSAIILYPLLFALAIFIYRHWWA